MIRRQNVAATAGTRTIAVRRDTINEYGLNSIQQRRESKKLTLARLLENRINLLNVRLRSGSVSDEERKSLMERIRKLSEKLGKVEKGSEGKESKIISDNEKVVQNSPIDPLKNLIDDGGARSSPVATIEDLDDDDDDDLLLLNPDDEFFRPPLPISEDENELLTDLPTYESESDGYEDSEFFDPREEFDPTWTPTMTQREEDDDLLKAFDEIKEEEEEEEDQEEFVPEEDLLDDPVWTDFTKILFTGRRSTPYSFIPKEEFPPPRSPKGKEKESPKRKERAETPREVIEDVIRKSFPPPLPTKLPTPPPSPQPLSLIHISEPTRPY